VPRNNFRAQFLVSYGTRRELGNGAVSAPAYSGAGGARTEAKYRDFDKWKPASDQTGILARRVNLLKAEPRGGQ